MPGEDRPIQRMGDANNAGGVIDSIPQSTVFADSLLVAVNGSQGTTDSNDHAYHTWSTANGDSVVFANSISVNFTDNVDTCGDIRVGGSTTVFVGTSIDQDTVSNRSINEIDETDAVAPGSADSIIAASVQSGNISASEIAVGNAPVIRAVDTSTATNTATTISTDCSDIASLSPFPTGDAIDAIVLTANYTVGKLTRKPYVVFDHALRSGASGLLLEEIVCNLKMIAVNIITPIIAQYPNMILTNTWRPAGSGSTLSQHPKGQACDMQFVGVGKKDYFIIAQWCRNNLVFDQLLLEYKTTGSGLPWIHLSFDKTGNKKQVLTLLNDKTYATGLVDLSGT